MSVLPLRHPSCEILKFPAYFNTTIHLDLKFHMSLTWIEKQMLPPFSSLIGAFVSEWLTHAYYV